MIKKVALYIALIALSSFAILCSCKKENKVTLTKNPNILSYIVNPKTQDLKFYWKQKNDSNYSNFKRLKETLQKNGKQLLFATNGGMYKKDGSPQGLYIEGFKTFSEIDRKIKGYGNFYLQPNGVFYITDTKDAKIVTTPNFTLNNNIKCATQSGPMLVIDGALHSKFNKGSKNLNIRNGVGVLPNGQLLFAMSKKKINFYDFATYFKDNGCENALYLDGFVSKTYLPSKDWEQLEGDFGVIIGVTE
jgi:uncharacterized protein YigE (DUF2233 family)